MTNPLLASEAPAASMDLGTYATILPVVSSAEGFGKAIADGDSMSAMIQGFATAVDVASAIIDPIAALAGSIAGFMLKYMPPLPDMLDALVGDPGQVDAMASTWQNIRGQISEAHTQLQSELDALDAQWDGLAFDAYKLASESFGQVMDAVGTMTAGVAVCLHTASAIIQFVREIVISLVSSLVGALISLAAEELATLGLGTPVVVAQGTTKIASTASKATSWSEKLLAAIKEIAQNVKTLDAGYKVTIEGLSGASRKFTVISLKSGFKAFDSAVSAIEKPTGQGAGSGSNAGLPVGAQ